MVKKDTIFKNNLRTYIYIIKRIYFVNENNILDNLEFVIQKKFL